jgi:hypothetical protein
VEFTKSIAYYLIESDKPSASVVKAAALTESRRCSPSYLAVLSSFYPKFSQ